MMKKSNGFAARTLIALAVAGAFPMHAAMAEEAAASNAATAATVSGVAAEAAADPAAAGQDATAPAAAPVKGEAGQLATVIVTAQRRSENIKDVPMAISTLSGDKLDVLTSGAADIRFLAGRVPSLNVESDYGRTFPRFYVRGLGNIDFDLNSAQPVGLVVDDVIQENAMLKGFPVFDTDQIEVARGPQGTLFGRNSPAGVVKFDSAKPVFNTEGYLTLGVGNYGAKTAEGVFNLPISDTVAARFSATSQHRDDRVHNPEPTGTQDFEGYGDQAARLQVLVKPTSDFSALFNYHERDYHGTATLFRANIIEKGTNDLVPGFDYGTYPSDGVNYQHLKTNGASVRLKWDHDGVTYNSITGWESLSFYSRADVDGGYGASYDLPMGPGYIPFSVETADVMPNHHQFTQEFRAASNTAGPLQWIGGLFYFKEHIQIDSIAFDSLSPGNPLSPDYTQQFQDARSWAAFGSLNYAVSDKLKIRGGLRYTDDSKNFHATRYETPVSGPYYLDSSTHNVSWDLSGTYELSKTTNLFSRIATGYLAPSMQGRLSGPDDRPSEAGAEKALSFELGVKQDLFNKRARLSASIYDYRIKDMQLTAGDGATNLNQLINAEKVVGKGAELDFQANLSDEFSMTLGGSYNYTQIRDPNLFVDYCGNVLNNPATGCTPTNAAGPFPGTSKIDGNPLPRAPRWQTNFTLRYERPLYDGEFYAYTDWSYRTKYNFFLYEAPEYTAKPLVEGGLRAGYKWANGKYEVATFARNILNKIQVIGAIDFDNLTGMLNEPRTYGATFKVAF